METALQHFNPLSLSFSLRILDTESGSTLNNTWVHCNQVSNVIGCCRDLNQYQGTVTHERKSVVSLSLINDFSRLRSYFSSYSK